MGGVMGTRSADAYIGEFRGSERYIGILPLLMVHQMVKKVET